MNLIIIAVLLLNPIFSQDKGKKAYEDGRFDDARVYYQNIIKNRGSDSAAKFGLGTTAYQLKDIETATQSLKGAIDSKDKSLAAKAFYNLGNILYEQNKSDESLAMYKKSLEMEPTDIDAKINYELLKQVIEKQQDQQQDLSLIHI